MYTHIVLMPNHTSTDQQTKTKQEALCTW